jgi:hypothetical protein
MRQRYNHGSTQSSSFCVSGTARHGVECGERAENSRHPLERTREIFDVRVTVGHARSSVVALEHEEGCKMGKRVKLGSRGYRVPRHCRRPRLLAILIAPASEISSLV